MTRVIHFISYKNHYLSINSILNFYLLIKILIKDKVFKLKVKYSTKDMEFIDLFAHKLNEIRFENLLKKYQRQV